MDHIRFDNALKLIRLTALSLLLTGCATQISVEPKPEPIAITSDSGSVPTPAIETSRIVILISNDQPIFTSIATHIMQRGTQHEYVSFNLNSANVLGSEIQKEIHHFDPDQVVAIGLQAAKAGRELTDTPMVFCKVFNYQDHNLLSTMSRGVKFLPPFEMQLNAWLEINPGLKTVGLIVGPNQDDLITEIRAATRTHNIQLLTRTVRSDKETLYAFKRLTPRIQGLWLLPDNRILSPKVLKEIVTYNRRFGNQTVVFNPKLIKLGADISFSSVDTDIADAVLKVIDTAAENGGLNVPSMTALTTLKVDKHADLSFSPAVKNGAQAARTLD